MFTRITLAALALVAISLSAPVSISAQVGYTSMTETCTLPTPLISDAEAAAMDHKGDSIVTATLIRRANAPTPNCDLPALESIVHDVAKINAIAYGKEAAIAVIKKMYLAQIAANYQKSAQTVGQTSSYAIDQ